MPNRSSALAELLEYVEEKRETALRSADAPLVHAYHDIYLRLQEALKPNDLPPRTKTAEVEKVVVEVLTGNKEPMRASDLLHAVKAKGTLTRDFSYENFVNYLSRMKAVKRVGRGTWGLAHTKKHSA